MKITYDEMKEIAKRLPVGYYLGRKTLVVVEEGGGAYCDVIKGDIHIGMDLLQTAANNIDPADTEKWNREALLRCLLYHEIGHLLMSPKWLTFVRVNDKSGSTHADSRALLNTFEDERLECILESVFMGVDFHGFCRLVNKNQATASESDVTKFYNAVRLRQTTQEISDAIDNAIDALASVNTTTSEWTEAGSTGMCFDTYYKSVLQELVDKILNSDSEQKQKQEQEQEDKGQGESKPDPDGGTPKDKPDEGESKQEQEQGGGEQEQGGGEQGEQEQEQDGKQEQEQEQEQGGGEQQGQDESEQQGDGESDCGGDGQQDEGDGQQDEEESEQQSEDEAKEGKGGNGVSPRKHAAPEGLLQSLASRIFSSPPPEVERVLDRFASRLAKKKGAQSAGCWSGLHGRISTKRDAMDKDKIFRRRSDVGDRLMSSVNLTLWIDVSGSFWGSKGVINQILAAVARTERIAGNKLCVNVVKMGVIAAVARDTEWEVDPDGDNDIDITYYNAWKETRKRDRRNIDIVVFDGLACWASRPRTLPCGKKIEQVIWDHPDCHIISDEDNKFLFKGMKKAHVTWMERNYAEQLQSEVIKILDRIL